jgi:hypothetical protein
MTEENIRPWRKPEEDAFRHSDSMMPARPVLPSGSADISLPSAPSQSGSLGEALPKTRKQRRLEQKGIVASDSLAPENALEDAELRKKARQFSLMVFNDPDLDPASLSSLAVPHEDIQMRKKGRKNKQDSLAEDIDMHALDARIESLLVRFLRNYEK